MVGAQKEQLARPTFVLLMEGVDDARIQRVATRVQPERPTTVLPMVGVKGVSARTVTRVHVARQGSV